MMLRRALHVAVAVLVPLHAGANVVGTDSQNFNSTTSGLDFVTVHSSETLKPGIINFGMFYNYAVNTLPYFENADQSRTNFNDALLGADFNMGVGLLDNLDAGVSFPFILHQKEPDFQGFRGQFASTGNTEVRLNVKYRLFGNQDGGLALIASSNFNRIRNNPYTGTDSGPTYNLEMAADTTVDRIALGANIGYRWRNPGTPLPNVPIQPYGNQMIGSLAASYLLTDYDTKLIGEIFGSLPASSVDDNSQRNHSSLELLVGVKHDLTPSLALHGGGGTELLHGTASPDWRLYAGLNWAIGPVIKKQSSFRRVQVEGFPNVEKFITENVFFEFNSDELTDASKIVLDEMAAELKKMSWKSMVVEGHTDSVGSDVYNQKLSERRARSIQRYMIAQHGFEPSRIQAIGYGESRPIADNGNYQGRQMNRRVEFRINR